MATTYITLCKLEDVTSNKEEDVFVWTDDTQIQTSLKWPNQGQGQLLWGHQFSSTGNICEVINSCVLAMFVRSSVLEYYQSLHWFWLAVSMWFQSIYRDVTESINIIIRSQLYFRPIYNGAKFRVTFCTWKMQLWTHHFTKYPCIKKVHQLHITTS